VAYVALALAAPAMPSPDLLLAAVTRDGVLSLLEAVPEVEQRAAAGTTALTGNGAIGANRRQGQDWRELDQIYAADGLVPRGTETCFRLAFQPFPTPTSYMNSASIGTHPLSLAIASLNEVRIYPVIPPSPYPTPNTSAFASSPNAATGSYHFGSPLAVLSAGNGRLVRDVAWSPAAHRTSAWIAAAAADGTVRVYDVASPKTGRGTGLGTPNHPSANNDGITGSNNGAPGSTSPLPGGTPGNTFGERIPTAPPPASTLTASLSRAAQPQLSPHPTTSALFPGAPSTTHLPSQGNTAEADLSGVAPAYSQGTSSPGLGGGLSVGSSGPRLEVKLVAELPHQGVWRVAWVRTGAMVISMGDSGQGHVWGPGMGGNWVEFAEFGAESEGE
jgi:WD40 repeat protein